MNKKQKQKQTKQAIADLRHISEVWLLEKVDDKDKLKEYFSKINNVGSILKLIGVLKEISEIGMNVCDICGEEVKNLKDIKGSTFVVGVCKSCLEENNG